MIRLNILDQVISKHVAMGGIWLIVRGMFVINITNVSPTIAYPGNMCAMEGKIVHLGMTSRCVHKGIVAAYLNAIKQVYGCAFIIMTSVTHFLIAP